MRAANKLWVLGCTAGCLAAAVLLRICHSNISAIGTNSQICGRIINTRCAELIYITLLSSIVACSHFFGLVCSTFGAPQGTIHKRRRLNFCIFWPPSLPLSPQLSLENRPKIPSLLPPSLPLRGDVVYGWSLTAIDKKCIVILGIYKIATLDFFGTWIFA